MNSLSLIVVITISVLFTSLIHAAPAEDLIVDLPGAPENLGFKQYAGYVTIDEQHGKKIFYWFVESENDPENDPVLLWMNGGPGASSLIGFFQELGPFRPNPDGKTLSLFEYRWNKIANIIWIEAPVGVGFSYSNVKSDYLTNDQITAADNLKFLEGWFAKFPEYKTNPFYITGESYAGHYVPTLAQEVYNANQNGTTDINIKGLVIGNPGIDNDWYYHNNEYAFLTFMYEHGLLPQASYIKARDACNWTNFLTDCDDQGHYSDPSSLCKAATTAALEYIPQNIDLYDIYAPVCHTIIDETGKKVISGRPRPIPSPREYLKWNPVIQRLYQIQKRTDDDFDECLDNYIIAYLNQPDVQSAIHVKSTNWKEIGNIIYPNTTDNMIPYFEFFIANTDWSILIFSGDADSAVPFIGTQKWIDCLGQPIKKDWRNWELNQQVAGSVIDYEGITFCTIKEAGHEVPWYKPEAGYAFYSRWFQGTL